jgi:hypothetical protein
MAKHFTLKSRRTAEVKKLSLAEKYAQRGIATGGGRIVLKKVRRSMESREVPLALQAGTSKGGKIKKGRKRTPPSKPVRGSRRRQPPRN